MLPASHAVEHSLAVRDGCEGAIKIVAQLVPVRQSLVELAADEPFEQVGAAAQMLGNARCAPQDFRQLV